jgi:polysaccharide biosynthesis/export protein
MFARMAKLAGLGSLMCAGLLAALSVGCSALNPLGFKNGDAEPLLPAANEIKNSVPMPPPVPRELSQVPLSAYILEPGEEINLRLLKLDSPARASWSYESQIILPDGKIDLGEFGRTNVAGMTIEQAAVHVQTVIEAKTPNAGPVQIRLGDGVHAGRSAKVYYVLGQVNKPGAFPLQGRETVLDGILAADGLNARSAKDRIIVSRPTPPCDCRLVLPVCYRQIVQLGDTTTNYQLQPGDRIYVPAKTFLEEICGEDKHKKDCSPCNGPQTGCPWNCQQKSDE